MAYYSIQIPLMDCVVDTWWRGYVCTTLADTFFWEEGCDTPWHFTIRYCSLLYYTWLLYFDFNCTYAGASRLWHLYVCALAGNGRNTRDRCGDVYAHQPSHF